MESKKIKEKKKLVEELGKYYRSLNVKQLYEKPDHKDSKSWLAEVAAILKNLDETDFRGFMNHRQHLYPSIPLRVRRHASEQIDGFVRQKVAEWKKYNFEVQEQSTAYINQEIIEGFIKKRDKFNYKKLIRLLGELNSSYTAGYPYSSSMLIRAIIDHTPPLLGYGSFEEVASNYSWPRTDKKYMKNLLDFRNEADDALHRPITEDPDLLEMDHLPNSNRVNRLLQECLKVGGTLSKVLVPNLDKQHLKAKNIQIKLVEEEISWAKYAVSRYTWSSFRLNLEINNYRSNKPDYISVSLEADSQDGKWLGKHFIFEGIDKIDEEFRIEANEVKKVIVFISDYKADRSTRKPIPEINKKSLSLKVATRSGEKLSISLAKTMVIKG